MMVDSLQWSAREQRLARLADEHGVSTRSGSGRYAAVIDASDGPRLVQADAIEELFAFGELRALVNLDYVASAQDR